MFPSDSLSELFPQLVAPPLQDSEREFGIRFIKFEKLYPTWCNAVFTTGAISDLIHEDAIDAVVGPGCSGDIIVCGKLATYYR